MVEQHQKRYGEPPKDMLVDGGFVKKSDITQVSSPKGATTVYAPVMQSKKDGLDPHEPRDNDSPAVAQWRKRMATDEAKEIYQERAATAECVNGIARNRGLYQVRVRSRPKVLAVVLWYVLAHNLMILPVLGGISGWYSTMSNISLCYSLNLCGVLLARVLLYGLLLVHYCESRCTPNDRTAIED